MPTIRVDQMTCLAQAFALKADNQTISSKTLSKLDAIAEGLYGVRNEGSPSEIEGRSHRGLSIDLYIGRELIKTMPDKASSKLSGWIKKIESKFWTSAPAGVEHAPHALAHGFTMLNKEVDDVTSTWLGGLGKVLIIMASRLPNEEAGKFRSAICEALGRARTHALSLDQPAARGKLEAIVMDVTEYFRNDARSRNDEPCITDLDFRVGTRRTGDEP